MRSNISASTRRRGNSPIFWLGAILLCLGSLGLLWIWSATAGTPLARLLPADTGVVIEVSLKSDVIADPLATPGSSLRTELENALLQHAPEANLDELADWVGPRVGVGLLPEKQWVIAAEYRSRRRAQKFVDTFLLPDEEWTDVEIAGSTIRTPNFSSQLAFVFVDGWLLMSDTTATLEHVLNSDTSLATTELWQDVRQDFSNTPDGIVWARTDAIVENWMGGERFAAQAPLLETLQQAAPAGGFAFESTPNETKVRVKFLTPEGAFSEQMVRQTPNQLLPRLAQFSPRDSLLFVNGTDLYAQYQQTRALLTDLHPQFGVVFDGILRAEGKRVFGEQFDFEQDFLGKMHSQYALILDFSDPSEPFTHLTLVTGFGGPNAEQNVTEMKNVVHTAQSQFSTKIVEQSLPDGTTRSELVATDPEDVPIEPIDLGMHTYFTAETAAGTKKFSFGFLDSALVFSTHEDSLRRVFEAFGDPTANLSQNADFRDSVLFDFPPSEGYGFANLNKLRDALTFAADLDTQNGSKISMLQNILSTFRTATFARRSFPNAVYWHVSLRPRVH